MKKIGNDTDKELKHARSFCLLKYYFCQIHGCVRLGSATWQALDLLILFLGQW